MDSLVRTSDSTGDSTVSALAGPLWPHLRPTTGLHGTHKISKAERTPMAHRERTGSALVNAQR